MNNAKLSKFFKGMEEQNHIVQERQEAIFKVFSDRLKSVLETQQHIILTIETITNLLKVKGVCTEDEVTEEFKKVQESLIKELSQSKGEIK